MLAISVVLVLNASLHLALSSFLVLMGMMQFTISADNFNI